MATEKLILLSEVKKKITAVRQYFSGPPSTDQDKLARSVAKLCMEEVGEIKPVDAVEVVRCKDCIHRHYVDMGDEIGAIGGCGLFGTPMMTCNDFCSYGERKDND